MAASSITPRMKAYVAAIHDICVERSVARISEIARRLNVSKSTVTNVVRELAKQGVVDYRPYGFVTISADSWERARALSTMKQTFRRFIEHELCIHPEVAERNADAVFTLNDDVIVRRMRDMLEHQKACGRHETERIQWAENDELICPYH